LSVCAALLSFDPGEEKGGKFSFPPLSCKQVD
jgi:hypothetical protein